MDRDIPDAREHWFIHQKKQVWATNILLSRSFNFSLYSLHVEVSKTDSCSCYFAAIVDFELLISALLHQVPSKFKQAAEMLKSIHAS